MTTGDLASGFPPADLLRALADPRRRYVLQCLCRRELLTLDRLARAVVEREREGVDLASRGEVERRVRVDLFHAQLPRLVDEDLLEFDAEGEFVRSTERGEQVGAWLGAIDDPTGACQVD